MAYDAHLPCYSNKLLILEYKFNALSLFGSINGIHRPGVKVILSNCAFLKITFLNNIYWYFLVQIFKFLRTINLPPPGVMFVAQLVQPFWRLLDTSWRARRCPWKKNFELFFWNFISLYHPPATHECPQKISAQPVQPFGRL